MQPFADPARPAILVTGAGGTLARKALGRLRALPGVRLVLLDRRAEADGDIRAADLAADPAGWRGHLSGIDAVLHLAGEARADAPAAAVARDNVEATDRLLHEAARAGVRRVVLASSNWVLAGHRFGTCRLDGATPPAPLNPYGWSKLANERAGAALAACHPVSVIALRIGYCPRSGRAPGPWMRFGLWGQRMWLGDDDWAEAALRSLCCEAGGFAVVNAVSDNAGMRWDIGAAGAVTGYRPAQRHTPRAGWPDRLREEVPARLREALSGNWARPLAGRWF